MGKNFESKEQRNERLKFHGRLLGAITPDTVENDYKRRFHRYLLAHSNEIIADGKTLSDDERLILGTFGNQGYNKVVLSSTTGKFKITEQDFIKDELRSLNKINIDLLYKLEDRKTCEFYKLFLETKLSKSYISDGESNPNLFFDFLDDIRKNEYSEFDITKKIKELTENFNVDLLSSISKDIDVYLFVERDEMESKFTPFDYDDAIKRRIDNGLEIPYLKRYKFKDLRETVKARVLKRYNSIEEYDNRPECLNKEALLFPFEFQNIYTLKKIVNLKILDGKPHNNNPSERSNDSIHGATVPKLFTSKSYGLFKYLYDEYYDEGRKPKKKLIHIWNYLKHDASAEYILNMTKEKFVEFLKENYKITITNKDIINYSITILKDLEERFKN